MTTTCYCLDIIVSIAEFSIHDILYEQHILS